MCKGEAERERDAKSEGEPLRDNDCVNAGLKEFMEGDIDEVTREDTVALDHKETEGEGEVDRVARKVVDALKEPLTLADELGVDD